MWNLIDVSLNDRNGTVPRILLQGADVRFAIAGAGGVGGSIGVRLALAGHEVGWLARGATLDALATRGIALQTPTGQRVLGPQVAAAEAAALSSRLGPVDAVLVAVKMYDLHALAPQLPVLAAGDAWVLPLQNGIEAHAVLAAHLRPAQVLHGTVSTKSFVRAPGEIESKSGFCKVALGGGPEPALRALVSALACGEGMQVRYTADIEAEIWRKFIMLASFSAVSCLARATIGEVLEDPGCRQLLIRAAQEALHVARAQGIVLEEHTWSLIDRQTRDMPKSGRPSMLEDLEAGRPLELDFLSGAVVRLGQRAGVATPVHQMAIDVLGLRRRGSARLRAA